MAYVLRSFLTERGLNLKTASLQIRTMDENIYEDCDGYSVALATGFSIHFLLEKLFTALPSLSVLAEKVCLSPNNHNHTVTAVRLFLH